VLRARFEAIKEFPENKVEELEEIGENLEEQRNMLPHKALILDGGGGHTRPGFYREHSLKTEELP